MPSGASELQAMPVEPDYRVPAMSGARQTRSRRREYHHCLALSIPDEALLTALKNAVARGVAIDLVVSRVSWTSGS
jgi:cardiolipin synthase